MATTPIELVYKPGKTLTVDIFPRHSDTASLTGQSLTEKTNDKGTYTLDITAALSGDYRVNVYEGSILREKLDLYIKDDTYTYDCVPTGIGAVMREYYSNIHGFITVIMNPSINTIKAQTDKLTFSGSNLYSRTMAMANDVITAAAYDESTAFPLTSADSGATALSRFDSTADTVDVGKINGSATAAQKCQYLNDAAIALTVDDATFTPTTTAFETDGIITDDDTLVGMAITWFNSSGSPANTGTYFISSSEGTTTNSNNKLKITTETMPAAPADGDVCVVIGSKVR